MFIVSYQNGGFVNRWAVNGGKTAMEIEVGHEVTTTSLDVLKESADPQVAFKDNRAHVVSGAENLVYLKDAKFRTQAFGGKTLNVLKVVNSTAIYNTSGVQIGTLPAGSEIGIEDGDSGNSMKHLLAVTAYNRPDDALGWRYLNQTTYSYGFINVQQGFGLKQYASTRAIETIESEVKNKDLDWSIIASAQAGKRSLIEVALRAGAHSDLTSLQTDVSNYFSATDLEDETIGDGEQYFGIAKQADFIEYYLAGDATTLAKYQDERVFFNA